MLSTQKPSTGMEYYPSSLRGRYLNAEKSRQQRSPAAQPSAQISWIPNFDEFQSRSEKGLLETSTLEKTVPPGWPERVKGPLVWSGKEFADGNRYTIQVSQEEYQELLKALDHFKSLGLDVSEVNRSNFPLPTFGEKLKGLSTVVHDGPGFFVLRGLDPNDLSKLDNAILFVGVSSYLAERRGRQNQDGMMLTHITDLISPDAPRANLRSVYSNLAQPFHTDVICDVLALYCLSPAASGGKSLIAPSWTVYNELAATRPDIIHTLSQDDWIHDTFGRNPPYHQRSLLHLSNNKPILNFSRRVLTGSPESPRTPGIPPITEAQAEALDAVHFSALRHSLEIELQAGDMVFINNFAIMHSRESFRDTVDSKRYLLRLWLNNPEKGWEIPEGLRLAWDRIFAPLHEIRNYWDVDPFGAGKKRRLRIDQSTSCG